MKKESIYTLQFMSFILQATIILLESVVLKFPRKQAAERLIKEIKEYSDKKEKNMTGVDPKFLVVMAIEKAKQKAKIPENPKESITVEQFNNFCQFLYKIFVNEED